MVSTRKRGSHIDLKLMSLVFTAFSSPCDWRAFYLGKNRFTGEVARSYDVTACAVLGEMVTGRTLFPLDDSGS